MSKIVRAGVIGAGVFGRIHAQKYAAHSDTELVGCFDSSTDASRALAKAMNCRSFDRLDTLLEACDIVSVATPATNHFEVAKRALLAGRSTLVEKPLAASFDEASELVALARAQNRILAVGHQERLTLEALGIFALPERPISIEAIRISSNTQRGDDVPVALDLLVHDANLVLTLLGEDRPALVSAGPGSTGRTDSSVIADVGFSSGVRARMSAQRQAPVNRRELNLVYPSGYIRIDFLNRKIEHDLPHDLPVIKADRSVFEDPVGENIHRFIQTVTATRKGPAVDGQAGLSAVWLAETIDAVARSGETWTEHRPELLGRRVSSVSVL